MSSSAVEKYDRLDQLAEEITQRMRGGELVPLDEYLARHPQYSLEIRDLYEAIADFESAAGEDPQAAGIALPQLSEYRLACEIGRGGMGVVYEAEHLVLGRRVALKLLAQSLAHDTKGRERFRREARAAGRLHHTNIVPVYEIGTENGLIFYTMQLIDGHGLDQVIEELRELRNHTSAAVEGPARKPPVVGGTHTWGVAEPAMTSAQLAQSLWRGELRAEKLRSDKPDQTSQKNGGLLTGEKEGSDVANGDRRPQLDSAVTTCAVGQDQQHGGSRQKLVPATSVPGLLLEASSSSSHSRSRWSRYYKSVARLGAQIASALAYAHARGVLHRDIKPSNVLLDPAGTAWVTDFGLAKDGDVGLTGSHDFVGTMRYMAPERFSGHCDERSDIYALGLTLYELLALKPAFGDRDRAQLTNTVISRRPRGLRARDPRIPRDLETIVFKAIEKEPDRRYRSADELTAELRRFLADEPIRARPVSILERLRLWGYRNPYLAILAASLNLVLLAVALGSMLIASEFNEQRKVASQARRQAESRAAQIRDGQERLKKAIALVDQGRFEESSKAWDEAAAGYSQAIDAFPDYTAAWEERGGLYLTLGVNDLAAADLLRAFQLNPPLSSRHWFQQALLRLHVGDLKGFHQVCDEMRQSYAAQRIARTAQAAVDLVRACALVPANDMERTAALELVQSAALAVRVGGRTPQFLHVLGTAHYRAGEYAEAIRVCQELIDADAAWTARSINYPVLAMASHALGQTAEANQALAKAVEAYDQWIEALLAADGTLWVIHHGATGTFPIDPLDWLEFQLLLREAQAHLGISVNADPRLVLLRARGLAALRLTPAAHTEYMRLMELAPSDPLIRLETLRSEGFYYVTRGEFSRAAKQYSQAIELMPADAELWRYLAIAYLWAEDVGAYRETCHAMLDRFADTTDRNTALSVVEVCVCRSDAISDWNRLVPLAQLGSGMYQDSERFLGAAQYRSGEYEAAVQTFLRVEGFCPIKAVDMFFLAMAHHRLGQRGEARKRFDQAEAWIHEANEWTRKGMRSFAHASWGGWPERPETFIARSEARALIFGGPS